MVGTLSTDGAGRSPTPAPKPWRLGQTESLAFSELVHPLGELCRNLVESGDSAEGFEEQLAPVAAQIVGDSPRLSRSDGERAFEHLSARLPKATTEILEVLGTHPLRSQPLTNPYTRAPASTNSFQQAGIQSSLEAFVVETFGMALVRSGFERDGKLFGEEDVRNIVRLSLLGRANKAQHVMLQRAAAASLGDPSSPDALREGIELSSLGPLGYHGGAKTAVIWEAVDPLLAAAGIQEADIDFLHRAARMSEGASVLESYRAVDTDTDIIFTVEPFSDIARMLTHLANGLVGTIDASSWGLLSPLDRQIVTNQAGLYGAHRHGVTVAAVDNKLSWSVPLDQVPEGSEILTDGITEAVWRGSLEVLALAAKLNSDLSQLIINARSAEKACDWLIDLVRWRMTGEDTNGYAGQFSDPGKLQLSIPN